jgi:hypothetical protein
MSDNRIKGPGGIAFGKAFRRTPQLTHVYIESCHLRDRGGLPIARSLAGESPPTTRNTFHWIDSTVLQIGSHTLGLSNLEELDMCYNEMTVGTAKVLSASLKGLASVVKVKLNGNEFGESGLSELSFLDE